MTCEAIEVGLQRSGKSLPSQRKTIRQAALSLLLASGTIAAAGYIAPVLIGDHQLVKASQVPAQIDGSDLRAALDQWAALDQARAEFQTAEAAIRSLDAQIVLQKSVIAQQKADVTETHASRTFAREDRTRYHTPDYGTVQPAQQPETALQRASAQLQLALVAAENKIEVLATERVKAEAERDRSRASLHHAALKLAYTKSEIAELDDDVMRDSAR
jgi:membrane fusion protein (multidrug efflux system)